MKILIIGEFSGFAKNLINGFLKIGGHEIVVFASQDGFKSIKQDVLTYDYPYSCIKFLGYSIPKSYLLKGFIGHWKFLKDIRKYKNYFDAAFIINSSFIRSRYNIFSPYFSYDDVEYVTKDVNKIFMSICGSDALVYDYFSSIDSVMYNLYSKSTVLDANRRYLQMVQRITNVIPVNYAYAESYRRNPGNFKIYETIPLPFDIDSVKYKDNIPGDTIYIYNGALRPEKGMAVIEEALCQLKSKYGERIFIVNDRLPYDKFLQNLLKINIYIDQCGTYHGIAAMIAMAAGCVTFSGNCPEEAAEFKIKEIPIVSTQYNENDIFEKLEWWINHPNEMLEMGRKSRRYVEMVHDSKNIASQYIKAFTAHYV